MLTVQETAEVEGSGCGWSNRHKHPLIGILAIYGDTNNYVNILRKVRILLLTVRGEILKYGKGESRNEWCWVRTRSSNIDR